MTAPWIVAFLALWVVVVVLVLVVLGLLRRVTSVLEQAEARLERHAGPASLGGAAPGTRIPAFAVSDASGNRVGSAQLLSAPAIWLFMSAGCAPCRRLSSELARKIDGVRLYVVMDDARAAGEFPLPDECEVLYQAAGAASRAFENIATPQAFAVDASGRVVDLLVPDSVADLHQLANGLVKGGDRGTSEHDRVVEIPHA